MEEGSDPRLLTLFVSTEPGQLVLVQLLWKRLALTRLVKQTRHRFSFPSLPIPSRLVGDRRNLLVRPPLRFRTRVLRLLLARAHTHTQNLPHNSLKDSRSKETYSVPRFNPLSCTPQHGSISLSFSARGPRQSESICELANFPCKTNSDIPRHDNETSLLPRITRRRDEPESPWRYLRLCT